MRMKSMIDATAASLRIGAAPRWLQIFASCLLATLGFASGARAQTWTVLHFQQPTASAPINGYDYVNDPDLFQGKNGQLWMFNAATLPNGSLSTSSSFSPAVQLKGAPAFITWGSNDVVFYWGLNDHLFVVSRPVNGGAFAYNSPLDTGIAGLTSAPVVGSLDNKKFDVLFRGFNNHLWEVQFSKPTKWGAAADLGGVEIQSAPTLVLMRDAKNKWGYRALYEGPNRHLWISYFPADLKKRIWWSAPEDLGGETLSSGPVATNLISEGTGRGVLAYYLTDSPTGTDRLRSSTWIGFDSHGNTDWWSAPQSVTIAGAGFTSDLGSILAFPTGAQTLLYRDSTGNIALAKFTPPTPPQPIPKPAVKLSASPDNGYVNKGQNVTITWTVSNCSAPCTVQMEAAWGNGYNTILLLAHNIGTSGSKTFQPSQMATNTQVTVAAFGTNGNANASLLTTLAPSPACPNCSTFYFKLTNSDPNAINPCFTESIVAASESAAQTAIENQNPGYTVTQIQAGAFTSACS